MVERAVQGLQGKFLQELRASQRPVAVFLVNGIRLQGRIEVFDTYMVAVKSTVTQLVYKHAISTIAPSVMKVPTSSQTSGRTRSPMSLCAQSLPGRDG